VKISNIQTFIVDAGWRTWLLVKVETDEDLTGWGECSDDKTARGVAGTIEDLKPLLIGEDPRAYEMRVQDMVRRTRQSRGGIAAKAMAGVELALIDLKARALGISVVELFGGPTREDVRLYWSHCGTSRVRAHELIGTSPLRSLDDVAALGREIISRGFTALKTNILLPGEPASAHFPGFGGGPGTTDQNLTGDLLQRIEALVATFRDAVGPDCDISLDLNFNFKPEACLQIARRLEPYDLLWLEVDMYEPDALRQIKDSTCTRICTGENLFHLGEFIPYLERHAADVFMVDVPWNGFAISKRIAYLAEVYQHNVAPHNYYSHLSSFISASLCAVVPNVRIMEIDIDDVPWKDDLVTRKPEITAGRMKTPSGPGWGTEVVEEAVRAHLVDLSGPLASWAEKKD